MNEKIKNIIKGVLLICIILVWDRYLPFLITDWLYIPTKHFAYHQGWVGPHDQFVLGFALVCFLLVECIPLLLLLILRRKRLISETLIKWSTWLIILIFINTIFCTIVLKFFDFDPFTIRFFYME